MRVIQGNMIGTGLRFAIIASRFNELITGKLIEGAKDALTRHDVRHQDIDIYWTLGAVIRGDTTHHEYVAGEAAKGLAHVSLEHRVPVAFGILTCENLEQALMRAGSKAGNKGADAALAALETANLIKEVRCDRGGNEA